MDFFHSPLLSFITLAICFSCFIVISSNSAVTSVIYLIFTFIFVAIYLCSLHLQYLGLTYVIIYVGAIIILLLFVIIIINLNYYGDINSNSSSFNHSSSFFQTLPLISIFILIFGLILIFTTDSSQFWSLSNSLLGIDSWLFHIIFHHSFLDIFLNPLSYTQFFNDLPQTSLTLSSYPSQIQSIALELYSHQALWLIILSFTLIISIIGPIVICKIKY